MAILTCSKVKPFETISAITFVALSLRDESLMFIPRVYNLIVGSPHFSPVRVEISLYSQTFLKSASTPSIEDRHLVPAISSTAIVILV